jgi:3-mercaptopyruvate sulfurtransferase SseA
MATRPRRAAPSPLTLVTAAELSKELMGPALPPLILDACSGNQPRTVLPGAVLFPLSAIDVYDEDSLGMPRRISGNYSLKPPAALRSALEAYGITRRRRVVCYTQARKCGGLDTAVCCRLAWALCCAGCDDVALLVGGLGAWQADMGNLAAAHTPPSVPQPAADFFEGGNSSDEDEDSSGGEHCNRVQQPRAFPRRPPYAASTADVEAAVAAAGLHCTSAGRLVGGDDCGFDRKTTSHHPQLADVRSHQEYRGGAHDYAFAMPRGRLPHARWAHWGPSTYVGGDFFAHDATGAMRPLEGIAALWRARGIEVRCGASPGSAAAAAAAPAVVAVAAPGDACSSSGGGGVASGQLLAAGRFGLVEPQATSAEGGPERRLIFYCGSGWRSAVAWCVAQLLGHANCANYDGGVLEWALLCPNAHRHALEGEELMPREEGGDEGAQKDDL